MSDSAGQARALTVLAPIEPGREEALRSHLQSLPSGSESPLASVPATHFARWVIVGQLVFQGPPQRHDELDFAYLLFTSNFDGPLEPYLEALCEKLGETADVVWGHCRGWHGNGDQAGAKEYLRRNRIATSLFVSGYPQATLGEVLTALELRERVTAFAIQAQGLGSEALARAWQREFGDA